MPTLTKLDLLDAGAVKAFLQEEKPDGEPERSNAPSEALASFLHNTSEDLISLAIALRPCSRHPLRR